MRKKLSRVLATATVMAGVAGGLTVAATAANASRPPGGSSACSPGYVCIEDASLHLVPGGKYYHYGAYNIYGFNNHTKFWIDNDQTGGARVYLCTGTGGNGSCTLGPAAGGNMGLYDLYPINSIYLAP